jgi:ankyrin repeat protein
MRKGIMGLALAAFALVVAPAQAEAQQRGTSQPNRPLGAVLGHELVHAVRTGNVSAAANALMRFSPNTRDGDRVPVIVIAAERRDEAILRLLLSHDARPDDRAPDRRTALSLAAQFGEADMVRALLEAGADPNLPGTQIETPLIKALRNGHLAVVRLLLEAGADPNEPDMTGRTPLEIADELRFDQAMQVLTAAGAR